MKTVLNFTVLFAREKSEGGRERGKASILRLYERE